MAKAIVLKDKVVIAKITTTATASYLAGLVGSFRPVVLTSAGQRRVYLRKLCK